MRPGSGRGEWWERGWTKDRFWRASGQDTGTQRLWGGEAGGEADTLVSVSGRWGSPWARELWDP